MTSQPIVTARGIIHLDGKLFLQKLKHGEDKNTFWSTPGGKLDAGEDIISGLQREMIEETGVEPVIGKLLFLQQFTSDDGREWLEFFFDIENVEDYQTIDLESTTHGMLEVAEYGFVDPNAVLVLPKGLAEIDFANHIEENHQVVVLNYL